MKHKINLTISILLFWQLCAVYIDKEVILPLPLEVLVRMLEMLMDGYFYQTLMITLSHVFIVVSISIILAFCLAYLAYQNPLIDEYLSPILTIIQAIPNISFVILVLVWASSLQTVYIVIFLVVFPLLYHNFIQGFKNIDEDLKDIILLYQPSLMEKFTKVYLPLIQPSLISGVKSSLSLGVKVAVMAEIFSGLSIGVGRAINYCRIQFDMIGVFAWTIWLILMILLIDYVLKKLICDK